MTTAPRTAVAMACDAGYAPYALALAASVAALHPDRDFPILLVSEAPIEVPATLAPLGIRAMALPAPNPFRGGPHAGRHGAEAYLRLLAPGLVAGEVDRLLYLDCDVLCLAPGLDRLMRADLGGHWLGAVRDNTQWRSPGRRLPDLPAVGRPARAYLNSGVLLIDVPRWTAMGIEARALALFRERPEVLIRHDQSILNILADGRWAEMSPVWNWQYTWSSRFFADLAEPRLVHFIGARKPWTDAGAALPARYRGAYATFMGLHYPDRTPPADPGPMGWPGDLRRSLLKHWAAAPTMERYLRRFPDPFTLL